jgi:hypothetical protein
VSIHNIESAYNSGILSIFSSVPGWACMLVGMLKMARGVQSKKEIDSLDKEVNYGGEYGK